MALLDQIEWDGLTPATLWRQLDAPTREIAARAVYKHSPGSSKAEADALIANAMRFRPAAIRKLPVEKRVQYLLSRVPVDDGLASTLLMALHLGPRAELLKGFLTALEIPHEEGLIDDRYDLQPQSVESLKQAIAQGYENFDRDHFQLYLAALVALDPETWGAIPDALS